MRQLGQSAYNVTHDFSYYIFGNYTFGNTTLEKPQDVPIDAVVTSLYFNSIVFVVLMVFYEMLRRILPTVYSSRKKGEFTQGIDSTGSNGAFSAEPSEAFSPSDADDTMDDDPDLRYTMSTLPDDRPLDWIGPVFGVPWNKVRESAGLDGYFFLRFIRMNVRITAVSTFWFFLILVPIYATGGNEAHTASGWYHISAANLSDSTWRWYIVCLFSYLFTAFMCFVIKQEYRHYLECRQDFLAKGVAHVNPQHHYSLMVENIPYELRSDRALFEYFDKLFPDKVHSASVVLNLPDLEEASARCMRSCRQLEKSIATLHATGVRPTHVCGRGRLNILGVDYAPFENTCCGGDKTEVLFVEDGRYDIRPEKGTLVDSISYYTQELAAKSRLLFRMQKRKEQIAESGNLSLRADNWYDQVARNFSAVANQILEESQLSNGLLAPEDSFSMTPDMLRFARAEQMSSHYGSFALDKRVRLVTDDHGETGNSTHNSTTAASESNQQQQEEDLQAPFNRGLYKSCIRRWAGQLGLDFLAAAIKAMNRHLDVALEGVVGETMSSTGFVTFLDLTATTCAATAPLSAKYGVLQANVAPEPREITWQNAHVSNEMQRSRERVVDIVVYLGVILWSFPLAAIQAFAKAKYLAQIPGLEWIDTANNGTFSRFVNGYLPVVALLALIMILPVLFEFVARNYEHRKTFSDVQSSMMGRYFFYQVANVYVTVTAGSIYKSLAYIIDRPSSILGLLGASLPSMVGYFVALLVTKILAGLPMIFLRFGALSRMIFLKTISRPSRLTQRELDAVYRLENIQYGWEYPAMLLVVVIVCTYAVICPVILPFGLLYFFGALVVYKKQILYVYSPVYESGGAMFPQAVQRSLFGLVCGQLLLLGYAGTRGLYYQPIFLVPLPVTTIWVMNYFQRTYAEPSTRLSLERAREYDNMTAMQEESNGEIVLLDSADAGVEDRRRKFDRCAYRQPVLTEVAAEPWTYRRGVDDEETMKVREKLRKVGRYATQVSRYAAQPISYGSDDRSVFSPV